MSPRISPDGKKVLYTLTGPWYEVWSYDMALGLKTRLTFSTSSGRASRDERLGVDSYYKGVDFYYRYLKAVTSE